MALSAAELARRPLAGDGRARARLLPRGWRNLALQVAIWFGFSAAYEGVRAAAAGNPERAFANGLWVIRFESAYAHHTVELAIQRLVESSHLATDLAVWTYWNAQFTVLPLALLWVYLRRHHAFAPLRNVLLLTNGIGLVGYILFPTAPPRLYASFGFVDTLARFSVLNDGNSVVSSTANPYAAMPSLHSADALVVGIALALIVRRRALKALWLLWPAWVWFCVIGTANHFWLDVVAGAGVAGFAAALVAVGGRLVRAGAASRPRGGAVSSGCRGRRLAVRS